MAAQAYARGYGVNMGGNRITQMDYASSPFAVIDG